MKPERAQKDENIGRIFDLVEELELDVVDVNHDQLDRLTEFQLHNGVCVDASILPFLEYKSKRLSLFLDRVLDPGNVGAIGRTAFYFGADGISYVKGRGPKKVTPSMSKSSCGALERLPVEQVPSFEHFYQKSKDAGAQIVATCDPAAAQRFGLRCTELKSWRPSSNVALVLGDEGIGIREEILKRCDVVVTIPHVVASEKLSSVTSLNAKSSLCSNGRQPGPGEKSRNQTGKCEDTSSYCRLCKSLCTRRENFQMMKRMCAATCDLCDFESFEEMTSVRRRVEGVANETAQCVFGLPRQQNSTQPNKKCVYPKEKMLNFNSTENPSQLFTKIFKYNSSIPTSTPNNTQNKDLETEKRPAAEKLAEAKVSQNKTSETSVKSLNTSYVVRNDTKLEKLPNGTTVAPSPSPRRKAVPVVGDTNQVLKNVSLKRIQSLPTSTVVYVDAKNTTGSFEYRKIKLEELMATTKDTMPQVVTAEPEALTLSLTKTVIRGKCFDEYVYCREFNSMCSHPTFSDVMSIHCALTCGRCDDVQVEDGGSEGEFNRKSLPTTPTDSDCEDFSNDCRHYVDLCDNEKFSRLLRDYCPKACGFCVSKCRDRHLNLVRFSCLQYAKDGFCLDEMYTKDERRYLCGDTCNMCSE
ncbi:unnamed protein product [Caenorhabditis auriculariae]|uniref:ShKT domain-containing protein n=1 Tax=Caenorhabditis auriculariae TaxID=2777116 RepID=A0A8S1GXY0_9PELO|nr:unnamed protein product [Caenorhabditis auriculariae]